MKKALIIILSAVLLGGIGGGLYYFFFWKNLSGQIVVPYIAHQKPRIDPHIPASVPLADKMDEVVFDGLFNVSANPSGITYEDGLGELMGLTEDNVVSIRLKPARKWHSSYGITMEKDKITRIAENQAVGFTAKDLNFTLRRIQQLGSRSPDYILVNQAVEGFTFSGPDENDEIQFKFRQDRIWTESDIKEVLSFKILPATSDLNAPIYNEGTGPYMRAGEYEDVIYYYKNLDGTANIASLVLKPYIDNSTFTTEIKNKNINSLLSTPFGAVSPILADSTKFFHKSNVSTTFFAVLYNFQRLNLQQRIELRKLLNHERIMERFFKIGTEQQRHISDYRGNRDNYEDYLNYSMFPTSSYYVDEEIVIPNRGYDYPDLTVLPDTVRIQTCVNYGFREELQELVTIMNDPGLFKGKVKVEAVQNEVIRQGNYDAVLIAVSGYRSNFLFDLYDLFLREPDFAVKKINLVTGTNRDGQRVVMDESFTAAKNFLRIDLAESDERYENKKKLLDYIYGFMSTHEVGDKQAYAQFIDELDQEIALGSWLFSLPSLAYFRTQFEEHSISLYGVASQLSTVEQWKEKPSL
ncbi:MAG: hypothetical protein GF398_02380 [Chitinivibrionales bacterium]|nr:hypothetical protein [Chitinivibrionales bacterium]